MSRLHLDEKTPFVMTPFSGPDNHWHVKADEEGRAAAAEGLEKFVFGRLYSKLVEADKAVVSADKALLQQMQALLTLGDSH